MRKKRSHRTYWSAKSIRISLTGLQSIIQFKLSEHFVFLSNQTYATQAFHQTTYEYKARRSWLSKWHIPGEMAYSVKMAMKEKTSSHNSK
jgi:hypothetical protein